MSNALAIIKPRSVQEAAEFSRLVAESAMLQPALRNRPADVFAIVLTGMEVGLGPMQALRSISIIQGKPSMDAALLVGLAKSNPKCKYFRLVESTNEKATYETLREGSPEPESITFTLDDARKLGLASKDNWQKQPATMLRARASAALARAVYQDSVLGLLAREEVGQEPLEAEYEEVEPAKQPEPERLDPSAVSRFVDFPVDDNSEREQMLKAEEAERKQNADDLHDMVNAVYPGDKNKALRKDKYAMFGLSQANPIKQFLGYSLERQRAVLKDVERWHAMATSDIPEWGNKAPVTEDEARELKEQEKTE
jgi:hypothetical protein